MANPEITYGAIATPSEYSYKRYQAIERRDYIEGETILVLLDPNYRGKLLVVWDRYKGLNSGAMECAVSEDDNESAAIGNTLKVWRKFWQEGEQPKLNSRVNWSRRYGVPYRQV